MPLLFNQWLRPSGKVTPSMKPADFCISANNVKLQPAFNRSTKALCISERIILRNT